MSHFANMVIKKHCDWFRRRKGQHTLYVMEIWSVWGVKPIRTVQISLLCLQTEECNSNYLNARTTCTYIVRNKWNHEMNVTTLKCELFIQKFKKKCCCGFLSVNLYYSGQVCMLRRQRKSRQDNITWPFCKMIHNIWISVGTAHMHRAFLEGVDYSNYDVIMCFRAAAATSQMLTSFRQQGSHVTQGFLKGNPNKRFQLPSRVATERVILSINW